MIPCALLPPIFGLPAAAGTVNTIFVFLSQPPVDWRGIGIFFLSPEIRFPILWESYDQDPPNRNAVLRSSIQSWGMAFADFSTFEREFGGL